MLVTLGTRNQLDDLVDLLAACHRRIRQHLLLARRLATDGVACAAQEIRDTASQIHRYFGTALPLHIADEDQTLAPRLRAVDPTVDAAFDRVARDHRDHQQLIDTLVARCAELEADPSRLATTATDLARLVELLAAELATHLELEERVIFPALRMLPRALRDEMREEMRDRRA